jgi:uncharacterized RDD family membrane protein YckC
VSTAPVVTPEAVPLELEPAGLGSRFLALLVDWTIQAAAATALSLALLATVSGEGAGVGRALVLLLLFVVVFGYPAATETLWRGRKVGKAAVGLRVVTVEGAPVLFRHAAIRAAFGLIDFMLTLGAAAVLSVLFTARNQRLGDLVAGTIVLRERTGLPAPAAVTFDVPAGLEPYVATLDVTAVSAEDYRVVRAFLLRAASLPPDVRYDLAVKLATPLVSRLRTQPPPNLQPEAFLACVAAAYQRRPAAPPLVTMPGATVEPRPPAAPRQAVDGDGFAPMD